MLRLLLALGLFVCSYADLMAGTVTLPAEVSVTLTAEPSINLQPGQRITLTLTATNLGPEPVDRLPITSSPIYNELDVYSASSDCQGDMILSAVDLEDSFYFIYTWYADAAGSLAPDETRTCRLSLDYTADAPPTFPVTFGFPTWLFDLDSSNNSDTVVLRRKAALKTVPALSPTALLLAGLLVAGGAMTALRCRQSH